MDVHQFIVKALEEAGCDVSTVDEYLWVRDPEGHSWECTRPRPVPVGEDEEEG